MKGISIIICCYNSERRIEETLIHIKRQKETKNVLWEVILVDNSSTDETVSVAQHLWGQQNEVPELRIVSEGRLGLRYARETGIRTAHFDYIIFVDDDNWLNNDYVFKVYRNFEKDSRTALIGGLGSPVSDSLLPIWYDHHQSLFAVGRPVSQSGVLKRDSGFIYGAGMALRKSAYQNLESKGFYSLCDDRIGNRLSGGHDVELSHAFRLIGYNVVFDEELMFSHYMDQSRLTLPYLKRLSAGSAANTIPFIYYLLLNRNVKSDFKFVFYYSKRIVGDLIDFLILLRESPLDYYNKEIMKTTYLSCIKHFIFNFFPSYAYYRNLKRIQKDIEYRNNGNG